MSDGSSIIVSGKLALGVGLATLGLIGSGCGDDARNQERDPSRKQRDKPDKAVERQRKLLAQETPDPLNWQQQQGYRYAEVTPGTDKDPGFTQLDPDDIGIGFTNTLSLDLAVRNQNLLNGAGLAVGDVDDDGLPDIYFCNREGPDRLYRNLGGWKFADVTEAAGLGTADMYSSGAVFADLNGDGALDLYVTSNDGPNAYYVNDGQGHFRNATEEAGLKVMHKGGTTPTVADYDGDGDLDLYVANYGENTILRGGGQVSYRMRNGKPVIVGREGRRLRIVDGKLIELGDVDVLFQNQGDGTFDRVPWTEGAFLTRSGESLDKAPLDMGLSAMFRDVNADGQPDLYVCNDFQTPDRFWINQGNGQFQALEDHAMRITSRFSMGIDFADIDRNGRLDLFVLDMLSRYHHLRMTQMLPGKPVTQSIHQDDPTYQARRNTLFWQRQDGTYAEIAHYAGMAASDWSWGVAFLDVDLDGYEDALITNGHAFDTQDLDAIERNRGIEGDSLTTAKTKLESYPPLETPNNAFHNQGDLTFKEVGDKWGYKSEKVSHGLATADFDGDGDLDVVVNCLNAAPLVYRNDAAAPRVAVRLQGKPPNTQAVGAKILVRGGPVRQSQEVIAGGRYLAGSDPMRVFAADSLTNRLAITVRWPDGGQTKLTNAVPNRLYEIDQEPQEAVAPSKPRDENRQGDRPGAPPSGMLFINISDSLDHTHVEAPFDDFKRQPSLPRKFSRSGPRLAWVDVDRDHYDDLVIGTGRAGKITMLLNNGSKGFKNKTPSSWSGLNTDTTGIVGTPLSENEVELLAGAASYERPNADRPSVLGYRMGEGGGRRQDPGIDTDGMVGPLVLTDLDADGRLDLFVGGRMIPGSYPKSPSSKIYERREGQWALDKPSTAALKGIGLVTGATASDLDHDGYPELILAREWETIQVVANDRGSLASEQEPHGLSRLRGWWQSVATGDFNEDGRIDIVAGNWGTNTQYGDLAQTPVYLYYGDFNRRSGTELLEAYTLPQRDVIVPLRNRIALGEAFPAIGLRFDTHEAYSQATVPDILKPVSSPVAKKTANHFASTLFLNRGDHFKARPLPRRAQFAPVFEIVVRDFNGDGHEDLFLAQNFGAVRSDDHPTLAGRGLLLKGDGDGGFDAMSGAESGIRLYGEQRGAAAADFNHDGRIDLAVGQNGGRTQLLRNDGAAPGIRVRLNGPPGNPRAIGAAIRLQFEERADGPIREIQAGSGYGSQNSLTPVLAAPSTPTALWVRWPGGKTRTYPINVTAPDAVEVTYEPEQ